MLIERCATRWEIIKNLGDPFDPSHEHDINAQINTVMTTSSLHFCNLHKHGGKRCKRNINNTQKNEKKQADVLENDFTRWMNSEADDAAELNKEKLNNMEKEVKVVGKSSMSMLFRERMKGILPHRPLFGGSNEGLNGFVRLLNELNVDLL